MYAAAEKSVRVDYIPMLSVPPDAIVPTVLSSPFNIVHTILTTSASNLRRPGKMPG